MAHKFNALFMQHNKTLTLLLKATAITSYVYAGIRLVALAIPFLIDTFNLGGNAFFQQIATIPPFVYYLTAIKLPLHAFTTIAVTIIAGIIYMNTAKKIRGGVSSKPVMTALITTIVLSFFGAPSILLALGLTASIIGLIKIEKN
jgi:hypothetical protein